MSINGTKNSLFQKMASLVTIADIQTPLGPDIASDLSVADALMYMAEYSMDNGNCSTDRIYLVVSKGSPVGWCGIDLGMNDGETVEEEMYPIDPTHLISGNTPYLSVVDYFRDDDPHFFFVLNERRISGTIHYHNLFEPPGRLCLFGLTLELETAALQLCLHFANDCLEAISEQRRQKAHEVWQKRHAHRTGSRPEATSADLIGCTTFIDKGKMIVKCKLLIDQGRSKIESVFARAERLRNACAHPVEDDGVSEIIGRNNLGSFLNDLAGLLSSINAQMPKK